MHKVILQGDVEAARLLIETGKLDLDCIDEYEETPLCRACSEGQLEIVKLLIHVKASLRSNKNGTTPLHIACARGYVHIASVLIEAGVAVESKDDRGNTPLHSASGSGQTDCAIYLIEHANANINVTNKKGNPPLYYAIEYSQTYTAFRLLQLNADRNILNAKKESFEDLLRKSDLSENEEFRLKHKYDEKCSSYLLALLQGTRHHSITSTSANALNWSQRPKEVNNAITGAFESIQKSTVSTWTFNGEEQYKMCHVDEFSLLLKMIQDNPERNDFYVLDIGAGDFQFGKALCQFLQNQSSLRKDVKVHIIGIRGEQNKNSHLIDSGFCKRYEFGGFKIEDLIAEFKNRGLPLENLCDIIISRWTFRHLVDPLGTLLQTYQLLRPETGFLFLDGFFVSLSSAVMASDNINRLNNVSSILYAMDTPYLEFGFRSGSFVNQILIKRKKDHVVSLPLSYESLQTGTDLSNASKLVTVFTDKGSLAQKLPFVVREQCSGSKAIYDELVKHALFVKGEAPTYRGPLIALDETLTFEQTMKAINVALQPGPAILNQANASTVSAKPSEKIGHSKASQLKL